MLLWKKKEKNNENRIGKEKGRALQAPTKETLQEFPLPFPGGKFNCFSFMPVIYRPEFLPSSATQRICNLGTSDIDPFHFPLDAFPEVLSLVSDNTTSSLCGCSRNFVLDLVSISDFDGWGFSFLGDYIDVHFLVGVLTVWAILNVDFEFVI